MSVSIAGNSRTVKAKDRLTVTLKRAWWHTSGIYKTWWENLPRVAQYVRTVSPVPVGADAVAVVDVAVTELGNGKSYGQIADDMDKVLFSGPDIIALEPLSGSDLRTEVAPQRRASAETEAAKRVADANPLNKIFSVGKGLTTVVGLLAVAVILFYVVPLLKRSK
jgi:hypothetical protein